jgi:hypothetical protein
MVLVIFFFCTLSVQCTERSETDYKFRCRDTESVQELLVVLKSARFLSLCITGLLLTWTLCFRGLVTAVYCSCFNILTYSCRITIFRVTMTTSVCSEMLEQAWTHDEDELRKAEFCMRYEQRGECMDMWNDGAFPYRLRKREWRLLVVIVVGFTTNVMVQKRALRA